MGQISMEKSQPTGSVLSGNQQSLVFASTAPSSALYIMPAFRALERRVADFATQLRSIGRDLSMLIKSLGKPPAEDEARRGLLLLDLTTAGSADALERLSKALVAEGRTVVLATHLNKRREPPREVLLRALHWSGDLTLPEGCSVLVDEADCLTLPLLERLLAAALAANADVVFCRRSYRRDMIANPTLSAIVSDNRLTLGGGDRAATDLPFDVTSGRTVQFVDDTDAAIRLLGAVISKMPAGRKAFFLCPDPVAIEQIKEYGRLAKRELLIGPMVPPAWTGVVVVLYSPLVSARHLRSIANLELGFVVPRTLASSPDQLARQLRLSLGQVTTLTDPVQPASLGPEKSCTGTSDNERNQATASVDAPWTSGLPLDTSPDREPARDVPDEIVDDDDPDPNEANDGWDEQDDELDPESGLVPQPDDAPDDDPG